MTASRRVWELFLEVQDLSHEARHSREMMNFSLLFLITSIIIILCKSIASVCLVLSKPTDPRVHRWLPNCFLQPIPTQKTEMQWQQNTLVPWVDTPQEFYRPPNNQRRGKRLPLCPLLLCLSSLAGTIPAWLSSQRHELFTPNFTAW